MNFFRIDGVDGILHTGLHVSLLKSRTAENMIKEGLRCIPRIRGKERPAESLKHADAERDSSLEPPSPMVRLQK